MRPSDPETQCSSETSIPAVASICDDLEIFILTYNRADLLKKAIESCINQTIGRLSITVLDNASTDHTADVVGSFHNPDVRLMSASENLGGLGNVKRAQEFASRKYTMIFHDDDQLHTNYIKRALSYLKETPDAKIAVANFTNIAAGAVCVMRDNMTGPVLKLDRSHFAAALYLRNKVAFCSAIYCTDALKSLDLVDLAKKFGKWGDRPIMITAVRNGYAILLTDTYVYCGRHDSQDTHQTQTQPSHIVWLNRERFSRDILGDQRSNFTGQCFRTMSHRRLKSGYKRRIIQEISFTDYLKDALDLGATTTEIWRARWMYPKFIQWLVDACAQRYLRKHFTLGSHRSQP